jgi:hypothetical protein
LLQVVALANLLPQRQETDDLDSYMYQTVGHQLISAYARCMSLPLYRRAITGRSTDQVCGGGQGALRRVPRRLGGGCGKEEMKKGRGGRGWWWFWGGGVRGAATLCLSPSMFAPWLLCLAPRPTPSASPP